MKTTQRISIQRSFRVIQGVVGLLLVFLVVQGCVLWHVCNEGTLATRGLESEGLPSLRHLASLQENLAIYRLHSYELMFAQEKDRPAKIQNADAVQQTNLELLNTLGKLYPSGEGSRRVLELKQCLLNYVQTMARTRTLIDADFAAAMKVLDTEVPAKVKELNAAAEEVKAYCTQVANERTGMTVTSFDNVRHAVLWLGSTSVLFAALAAGLVSLNSWRVRRALMALMERLSSATTQLMQSAAMVTSSSQAVAQGASEQAASLEETGTSLEEIGSMTRRNAENANEANNLAKQSREAAEHGTTNMRALATAMSDIQTASDDIAKIIKTIDEIAFQTNILALNAAVEAARAGEAGMGFAVVADEVRALAQRSAKAAKETAAKIEGAIGKAAQGVDINAKVAQALNDILARARQVDELVSEVASASKEQSHGIDQVNGAVNEMDKVTQNNAASAEESASAASELNSQADALAKVATDLQHLVGGVASTVPGTHTHATKNQASESQPAKKAAIHGGNGNGNGSRHRNGHLSAKSDRMSSRREELPLDKAGNGFTEF